MRYGSSTVAGGRREKSRARCCMSKKMWPTIVGLAAGCAASLVCGDVRAFKIGYSGVPIVVADFPSVHEATTAEAMRHVCVTIGVAQFRASRFFQSLLD